mgnify:CR=1 FL=1
MKFSYFSINSNKNTIILSVSGEIVYHIPMSEIEDIDTFDIHMQHIFNSSWGNYNIIYELKSLYNLYSLYDNFEFMHNDTC